MKKLMIFVSLLAVILLATPLVETVAANRGRNMKEYANYRFEAVLTDEVYTVVVNFPNIVIEGYRPDYGVQSCVVTINGEAYSYPEDFSYAETFCIEGNLITGEGVAEVKTVLTFNLPGNPTLTDWLSAQVTGIGTSMAFEGVFYLTGTKMFHKVEGGGVEEGYNDASGALHALHIGLIKGWPL